MTQKHQIEINQRTLGVMLFIVTTLLAIGALIATAF